MTPEERSLPAITRTGGPFSISIRDSNDRSMRSAMTVVYAICMFIWSNRAPAPDGKEYQNKDWSCHDFSGRDLTGADFSGAILKSANFDRANLTNAKFVGAVLGRKRSSSLLVKLGCFALSFYVNALCTFMVATFGVVLFSLKGGPAAAGFVGAAVVLFGFYGILLSRGNQLGAYFSGTLCLAGVCSGAALGSVAVAGSIAGAISIFLFFTSGPGAAAGMVFGILHLASCLLLSWRTSKIHKGFEILYWYQVKIQSIQGTSFKEAVLTGTDFRGAFLRGTRFTTRTLGKARLRSSLQLRRALCTDLRFRKTVFRDLLITGKGRDLKLSRYDLSECDLTQVDLTNADLSHADLTHSILRSAKLVDANLAEAHLIGTDLTEADLTGACLRGWNIDSDTILDRVECHYFYLGEGHVDRRPHNRLAEFQPGVFEQLFRQVQDTIQFLVNDTGNRADWINAFRRVMQEYPLIEPNSLHSIQRINDGIVVNIISPPGIDKEGVEKVFQSNYARQMHGPLPNILMPPQASKPEPSRARVFISYAREDLQERTELEKHLKTLQREGMIEVWHDKKRIGAGGDWDQEISTHLAAADVILLLISVNFINSDYAYEREMKFGLERARRKEAIVVPIIVSSCDWEGLPFSMLRAYPDEARPIDKWPNRNEAWTLVVRGLRKAIVDSRDQTRPRDLAASSE